MLFNRFETSFGRHGFNVTEVQDIIIGGVDNPAVEERYEAWLVTKNLTPMFVLFVQIGCTYGGYIFSKFACKVQIQQFSFAVPLSAVVPVCLTLTLAGCGARAQDPCAFHAGGVPDYLFFECPAVGDFFEYVWSQHLWLWLLWFLSQLWVTLHIWFPNTQRLASTEQIFGAPMYNSLLIDQSVVLNRRRDGDNDFDYEEIKNEAKEQTMSDFYEKNDF